MQNSGIRFAGAPELIQKCKSKDLKVVVASSADHVRWMQILQLLVYQCRCTLSRFFSCVCLSNKSLVA